MLIKLGEVKLNKKRKWYLSLFFVVLIFSTYLSKGEEFIIISFIILFGVYRKEFVSRKNLFIQFILYYGLISLCSFCIGIINMKNLLEYIVRYVCLIYIVWELTPNNIAECKKAIHLLGDFIGISALYGFIEWIIHYNFLYKFMKIDAANWIIKMNEAKVYQPSSFFLHYNFYGCILLVGWVISLAMPYRDKRKNIVYQLLILMQLLIAQSRICWIACIIVTIIHLRHINILTIRNMKRMFGVGIIPIIICLVKPNIVSSLFNAIKTRFAPIFIYGFEYGSFGQRIGTLLNWPRYFFYNPLKGLIGTGFGSITCYLEEYSYFEGYTTADCQWTTYLVECGLVGTLFLIGTLFCFLKYNKNEMFYYVSKLGIVVFFILSITFDVAGTSFIFYFLTIFIVMILKQQGLTAQKEDVYRVRGTVIKDRCKEF